MNLPSPDLVLTQTFGRLAEMAGEPGNLLDVNSLRLRREVTDPHILDHAAAKRGHWQLLCKTNSATWRHRIVSRLSCQARGRGSSAVASVKSEKLVSITRLPRSGLVQRGLSSSPVPVQQYNRDVAADGHGRDYHGEKPPFTTVSGEHVSSQQLLNG